MLGLVYAIKALPDSIHNCRIDTRVDSIVVIDVWGGQGSKSSSQLTSVTKQLFFQLASRNIQLNLLYVPSGENLADDASRCLSRCDSALSLTAFEAIDRAFGDTHGHSFDLMALDSNDVRGRDDYPLPHFSPFPSPQSRGVNLFCQHLRAMDCMSNRYVFPPFSLIGAVLKFLYSFGIPFTIVLPLYSPRKYCWAELMARACGMKLSSRCR